MGTEGHVPLAPVTVADNLCIGDLASALKDGLRDFLEYPQFGLFFAAIYVCAGIAITYALATWNAVAWLIPAAAGFPLIAPFVAVGLYEVSRRREIGLPMNWRCVLGALRGHGDDQIISMGVIVFVAFGFWLMVAHGIFAIFLAESGIGAESLAIFETTSGVLMLAIGTLTGGLMALAFYSITVISLPMLVDHEVDFLTAIIVSVGAIRSNRFVLLVWALVIAVVLALAIVPLFLGLLVALPVLAHATWHLYRRTVRSRGI